MRLALIVLIAFLLTTTVLAQDKPADHAWIATSNDFTQMLLKIEMKHSPESGSRQGLAEYDELISQPTLADEDQERKEAEEVVTKFKAALPQQKQKEVAQDLEIMIRRTARRVRIGSSRSMRSPFFTAVEFSRTARLRSFQSHGSHLPQPLRLPPVSCSCDSWRSLSSVTSAKACGIQK
jgi:hypothetical protein